MLKNINNNALKYSILASIKHNLRRGNNSVFNLLSEDLKVDLVRSYRDIDFKKSVVKAHNLSISDELLRKQVELRDSLGLTALHFKAYSMVDYQHLSEAVHDEVEIKYPIMSDKLEDRLSHLKDRVSKAQLDKVDEAKALFRSGWNLEHDIHSKDVDKLYEAQLELDKMLESQSDKETSLREHDEDASYVTDLEKTIQKMFEDSHDIDEAKFKRNKTRLLDLGDEKRSKGLKPDLVDAIEEYHDLVNSLMPKWERKNLGKDIKALTKNIKSQERLIEKLTESSQKGPVKDFSFGWSESRDDDIQSVLQDIVTLEDEIDALDTRVNELGKDVSIYTTQILDIREELRMGDREFDRVFLDTLGIKSDIVEEEKGEKVETEEEEEADKFTDTEYLYEDDEIIQKKSSIVTSDLDSDPEADSGLEILIFKRHKLQKELIHLMNERSIKMAKLEKKEVALDNAYLERNRVRNDLYRHFRYTYGDDEDARVGLEIESLEDRKGWLDDLYGSGRLSKIKPHNLASQVFSSDYNSLNEDSKFIFSQILEHSFFGLPLASAPGQGDFTLTHPDWEGFELSLGSEGLKLFRKVQKIPNKLDVSKVVTTNKGGYLRPLVELFRKIFQKKYSNKHLSSIADSIEINKLVFDFKDGVKPGSRDLDQLEEFLKENNVSDMTFEDLQGETHKGHVIGKLKSFVMKSVSNKIWYDFIDTIPEVDTKLENIIKISDTSITDDPGAVDVGPLELYHQFFLDWGIKVTLSRKLGKLLSDAQEESPDFKDFSEDIIGVREFKTVIEGYLNSLVKDKTLVELGIGYDNMEGSRYHDLEDTERKSVKNKLAVKFIQGLQKSRFKVERDLDFELYEGDVYFDKFPEGSLSVPSKTIQRRVKDPDKLMELELTMNDINSMGEDELRHILIQKGELPGGSKQDPFQYLEDMDVVTEQYTHERKELDFSEIKELPSGNIVDEYLNSLLDTTRPAINSLSRYTSKEAKTLRNRMFSAEKTRRSKEHAVGDTYLDVEKGIQENLTGLAQSLRTEDFLKDEISEDDYKGVERALHGVVDQHKYESIAMDSLRDALHELLDHPDAIQDVVDMSDKMPDASHSSLRNIIADRYSKLGKKSVLRKNLALQKFVEMIQKSDYSASSTKSVKRWVDYIKEPSNIGSSKESFFKRDMLNTLFSKNVVDNIEGLIQEELEKGSAQLSKSIQTMDRAISGYLGVRKDYYKAVGGARPIINALHKLKLDIIIGPDKVKELANKYLLNQTSFSRLTPGKFLFEFFAMPYLIDYIKGQNPANTVKKKLLDEFQKGTLLDSHLVVSMDVYKKQLIEKKMSGVPEEERSAKMEEVSKEVESFIKRNVGAIEDQLRSKINQKFKDELSYKRMFDPDTFEKSIKGVFSKPSFFRAILPLFSAYSNKQGWQFDEDGSFNLTRKDSSIPVLKKGTKEINYGPFLKSSTFLTRMKKFIADDWRRYSKKVMIPTLSTLLKDAGENLNLDEVLDLDSLFNFDSEGSAQEDQDIRDSHSVSNKKLNNVVDMRHIDEERFEESVKELSRDELKKLSEIGASSDSVSQLSGPDTRMTDLGKLDKMMKWKGMGFDKPAGRIRDELLDAFGEDDLSALEAMYNKSYQENKEEYLAHTDKETNVRQAKINKLMSLRSVLPKVKGKSLEDGVKALRKIQHPKYKENSEKILEYEALKKELEESKWFDETTYDFNKRSVDRIVETGLLEETGDSSFSSDVDFQAKAISKKTLNSVKDEKWFYPMLRRSRADFVEGEVLLNLTSSNPNTNKRYQDFTGKYGNVEWFELALENANKVVKERISRISSLMSSSKPLWGNTGSTLEKMSLEPWFKPTVHALNKNKVTSSIEKDKVTRSVLRQLAVLSSLSIEK